MCLASPNLHPEPQSGESGIYRNSDGSLDSLPNSVGVNLFEDIECYLEAFSDKIAGDIFEQFGEYEEFLEERWDLGDSYLGTGQKHLYDETNCVCPHVVRPEPALVYTTRFDAEGGWFERQTMGLVVRDALGDNAMHRFVSCGIRGTVQYCDGEDGSLRTRIRGSACKNRICPSCNKKYKQKVKIGVERITSMMGWRSMVTLTLRHNKNDTLEEVMDKLENAWNRLRRRKVWTSNVTGSIRVVEITKTEENGWHPHLHVIADAKWIPWAELKDAWHEITTDSFSVKIKRIKTSEGAAHYVSKYVTKETQSWNDRDIFEYLKAMKGKRLISTTGWCRDFKILGEIEDEEDELMEEENWESFGTVHDLFREANNGSALARRIIEDLYGREVAEKAKRIYREKKQGSSAPNNQMNLFI